MRLDEITDPKIDQAGPPPSGEFTYVDISSVDNSAKRIVEPKRLPADSAPSRARQGLRSGDVLVSMTRPNLNAVALVPPELDGAIGSTGFHVLRARDNVLPQWLYYGVQTRQFVGAMSELVQGALYPAVRPKDIRAFDLPVPGLGEQRRIVAELEKQFSRLDEAVANLKRVAGGLARYMAATLSESFAAQPDWTVSSYGEIGVVTTGFTPPTTEAANFGGAIPFFKPTDLDAGEYLVSAREHLSDRGMSKGRLIPANSVLVTCIGATIGKAGLARVACATNQQINAVSPDPAKVDARFLYFWTISPRGREQIVANASATTLPILNKSKFSALPVPVPEFEEQKRIVAEIDRRFSVVKEVEAEVDINLKRGDALRKAILARAFSV
jgi:type I restriction enzyme S subunit